MIHARPELWVRFLSGPDLDRLGITNDEVIAAVDEIAAALPEGTADRPIGRDFDRLTGLLAGGWSSRGR
jgi:hypothetical protein